MVARGRGRMSRWSTENLRAVETTLYDTIMMMPAILYLPKPSECPPS